MPAIQPFQPMLLRRMKEPFCDPDWIFELKYDGFRAFASIVDGACQLISRNSNQFKSFEPLRQSIARSLPNVNAVLDGEIVCLDERGRPRFNDLLFRRGEPCFAAFDIISVDDVDLRNEPLFKRKRLLKGTLGKRRPERVLFVGHVEENGKGLFDQACSLDLEGIVAKHEQGLYVTDRDKSSWFKIRNPRYSQMDGRAELFEPKDTKGARLWESCAAAAATSSGTDKASKEL